MVTSFKAWDKNNQKMLHVISVDFDECYIRGLDIENEQSKIESIYHFDDIVWIAYTGLNDKYDKPIYEADIIKKVSSYRRINENIGIPIERITEIMEERNIPQYELATIERKKAYFGVKHIDSDGVVPLDYNVMTKCEDIEVIGNIYQDSQLLENDK